jgi:glutathione S-transferase
MRRLYLMPYSCWSERARWALLHHRFEFSEIEHVPLLGELGLRLRTRRWRGPATVPLLVDGDNPVRESLAIAEYVDALGGQASLFPGSLRTPIRELHARVEPTVAAQRAYLASTLDDEATLELTPAQLRRVPLALRASRISLAFLARKHGVSFDDIDARLRAGYQELRALLAGRRYVYEQGFTYADIICSTALQALAPVDDCYVTLGPATRRCWQHAELAREFADLLAWRDEIYRLHRPLGPTASASPGARAPEPISATVAADPTSR